MKKLLIIRGIPGSGKSTLAKSLTPHVFEADQFFIDEDGAYKFNPARIQQAHMDCQARTEDAMHKGVACIAVANTFTRKWEYHPYLQMAVKYGYAVRVIVADGQYQNIHGVPPEVVERMKKNFES